ncbi:MAG: type IV pilus twitching motility protein PilT [Chitinispirillaceae bacterium]|nr:type IV pilus twitching motility protein PilT [Chitinispirillaceae bacterium]
MAKIDILLRLMLQHDASDMHISVGNPPVLRINGQMLRAKYHDLSAKETEVLLLEILDETSIDYFRERKDLDFAYELPGEARFRCNIYIDKDGYAAAFRNIPNQIRTLSELMMPDSVRTFTQQRNGLILVTGPTGSGKTTTLAAMIDQINKTRCEHIITLEDPIEYIYPRGKSVINQRQIGLHAGSFASGLRAALREDPDVVLVGEMRDLETIHLALTAAETGLLVFGTLHTSSASKTLDRIIDAFPADQQAQVRTMISESLRGVMAQQLLTRKDRLGRVAALEVLICTQAVKNLIREAKTFQLPTIMQTGSAIGMQTLEGHVRSLVERDIVSPQEAAKFTA